MSMTDEEFEKHWRYHSPRSCTPEPRKQWKRIVKAKGRDRPRSRTVSHNATK